MAEAPERDEITLRTGVRLVVRPIRPQDASGLVSLHDRLSADTVYRRYFAVRPRLAPTVVDRFTHVAEQWRFALVAVRADAALVAVARYEGEEATATAELAMVVDDALQRSGVGRIMFGRLIDVARERGVRTLVADVLPNNWAMLGLLRTTGLPITVRREDGYNELRLDLTAHQPDEARQAIARAHLAAARAVGTRPESNRKSAPQSGRNQT